MTASPAPSEATSPGSIALIGAGPGDVDLLTLRAVERLRAADVILYDDLAGDEILSFARPDAELIAVGKRAETVVKVRNRVPKRAVKLKSTRDQAERFDAADHQRHQHRHRRNGQIVEQFAHRVAISPAIGAQHQYIAACL